MICQKRIRNVDHYLLGISDNEEFYVGVKFNKTTERILLRLGFPSLETGMQILPQVLGPISRYNALGKEIKHKDLPMETCYRQATVTDWHGYSHNVTIPYKRYPRTYIPAPSIELFIVETEGYKMVISPLLCRSEVGMQKERNLHVINLFLELFSECEILKKDLAPAWYNVPVKRVNWNILPEGEYAWVRVQEYVSSMGESKGFKKRLAEYRAEVISNYKPNRLIVGQGGFKGYLIFEFADRGIYVLENLYYGNATYIMGNDWERVSQMTKAEVINNDLCEARIIHSKGWEEEIDQKLS